MPEGIYVTLPKRYDQLADNKAIVDAIKTNTAQNRKDPTGPFVWTTYAAIQSLVAGIERSKSDEPEEIAKNLKAGEPVPTVMGKLNWDQKGDLKGFEFGMFKWHKDGSSTAVK